MTASTETSPIPSAVELDALRTAVGADLPAYLADLERLVDIDCGSYTPAGVDAVGRWVAAFLADLGADVETRPDPAGRLGATLVATFRGRADGPRVLLIGHMDTVFDPGTAAERPFRIDDGVAYGPGVTDMKSGLLAGLYALKAIITERGGLPFERLVFVANPDEEIGSPTSTPHIREIAADSDVALVLECARANGDIVSARKGILDLRIVVHGRAAHAGVEPEKGRSAILEAARIVRDLHDLNGRWPDVTVNVGLIAGGTRPNVVAERCSLEVDVRATTRDALETAEAEIRRIAEATEVPDTTVEFEEMARWWPMEKLERSGRLVDHAVGVARALGFEIADVSTGGASDANTTSGHGHPEPRRSRADRRQRPFAGGIPRGRFDRAPDHDAGRSPARHRRRPGGHRLAGRPRRRRWRRRSGMTERRRISSGGPWEGVGGYSRAIVVGDSCWVAGTTDAGADGRSTHPDDIAAQARAALGIIEAALGEAGFGLADVVRTRMYVTDIARSAEVVAVHGEVFGGDPAGRDAGRGRRPDRSEPADRDRGRGPPGLTGQAGIAASPAARAMATMATAATRPRNRLRRRATMARQTKTATHSMPTWNDGTSSSPTTTITLTAASAARTAGPTSCR